MTQPNARTDEAAVELGRMLDDLTRAHRHREHYVVQLGDTAWARDHVTQVPSLLTQLRYASPSGEGSSRSGAGFESRPAAPLESLDTLVRIDLEASRWVTDMGATDEGSTLDVVRRLAGLLPSTDRCARSWPAVDPASRKVTCCRWHAVFRDVQRWWTQARVLTGWDTPAWRPDATCPMCGVRRSLRIRLEDRTGLCVECHETWGQGNYQMLADHVRAESEKAKRALRAKQGPCWCPVPRPAREGLAALCPRCGSTYCRHAVRRAGDEAS